MWKDAQSSTHVQLPDDVGGSVVVKHFILIRTIVLAVAKTLGVEATELALGGDVIQSVPFHIRRARCRGQQELSQTSLYSRSDILPTKFSIARSKRHEHSRVFLE